MNKPPQIVTHVDLGSGAVTYETVAPLDHGEVEATGADPEPWTRVEHSGPNARKITAPAGRKELPPDETRAARRARGDRTVPAAKPESIKRGFSRQKKRRGQ